MQANETEAPHRLDPKTARNLVLAGPLELAILGYLWRNGDAQAFAITRGIREEYGQATVNTVVCTLLRLERKGWVGRGERRSARNGGQFWRHAVTRSALADIVAAPIWEA